MSGGRICDRIKKEFWSLINIVVVIHPKKGGDITMVDDNTYGLLSKLHQSRASDRISAEEEYDLARRVREKSDEVARAKLVRANLRYVASVAHIYVDQGVPFGDLVDEGVLGLYRATHKFDEREGNKFISYATWWIRQAMQKAIAEQGRNTIRIPMYRLEKVALYAKAIKLLINLYERHPTDEEVAEVMECEVEDVRQHEVISFSFGMLSLDKPIEQGEGDILLNIIPDERANLPDEEPLRQLLCLEVGRIVETLGKREEDIIRRYFGLPPYEEPMTLEEIAKCYGLTRERIRQVKEKALERLSYTSRGAVLRELFEWAKASGNGVFT